jgi:hypothetical protein
MMMMMMTMKVATETPPAQGIACASIQCVMESPEGPMSTPIKQEKEKRPVGKKPKKKCATRGILLP